MSAALAAGLPCQLSADRALTATGLYECTLQGEGFHFIQKRSVGTDTIKSAPNVRVQQALWVKCKEGEKETVICCVQSPYNVRWYDGSKVLSSVAGEAGCIKYEYPMQSCSHSNKQFTCKVTEPEAFQATTTLNIFTDPIVCNNTEFGTGRMGDKATTMCAEGLKGYKSAVCLESAVWKLVEDFCIVTKINELFIDSVVGSYLL
ncbi:hypothetical protein ATANTOWER_013869 [Ataeniobius toweri]|uniref:Uncharacterized protein n=1 Tax=Ataeniobius toweri TaxID=208326 RepID=A0ABU7C0J8_9TELE|nr:hypothetical protein [Ataeniobius toweri]